MATDSDDAKRYVCTAEKPWVGGRATHPDAKPIRKEELDWRTCEVYRCPNCGLTFHVENPH